MIDAPRTRAEAQAYRYEQWAGNPRGTPYRSGRCAYEVAVGMLFMQCRRYARYGPDELYCKQHAACVDRIRE